MRRAMLVAAVLFIGVPIVVVGHLWIGLKDAASWIRDAAIGDA